MIVRLQSYLVSLKNIFLRLYDLLILVNRFFRLKSAYKKELPSGIIVRIYTKRNGAIYSFSLSKNQNVFERMNWTDSLYSVTFDSENDYVLVGFHEPVWDKIRAFCRKGLKTDLPPGWKYDATNDRIWFWSDGEIFSLPTTEVANIDKVINDFIEKGRADG